MKLTVAASLFQIGKYDECLLWCEGLAPAIGSDAAFASMYGAVLRRLESLDAQNIFKEALSIHTQDNVLKNNYANLLTDLKLFNEAEKILIEILREDPNYEDAKSNLNRVNPEIFSCSETSPNHPNESKIIEEYELIDPLAAASETEVEISKINVSKSKKEKKQLSNELEATELPNRAKEEELRETLELAQKSVESNPKQSIKDCRILHKELGINSKVYLVAAQAYIRLKLFADAENALLVAHGLGEVDPSVSLNLANLASMRGDQLLALYWLENLAERQPDNQQLEKVRKTLFPNGAPTKSTDPFQLNMEEQSDGFFK